MSNFLRKYPIEFLSFCSCVEVFALYTVHVYIIPFWYDLKMTTGEYDPERGPQHFPRPQTFLNRGLRKASEIIGIQAELTQAQIDDLKANSIDVYSAIALDSGAVESLKDVPWYLADDPCPPEVLGGEVTFSDGHKDPQSRFFPDAPILSVKSDKWREAYLLGLADHFNGHLYSLMTGSRDFGEDAAIYWQGKAAHARVHTFNDPRFFGATLINRLGYRGHKNISPYTAPFDFFPLNKIARTALGERNGRIEATVLDDPALGWARLITEMDSKKNTMYYRRIPFDKAQAAEDALLENPELPFRLNDENLLHNILGGTVVADTIRVEQVKTDGPDRADIEQIDELEEVLVGAGIGPSDPQDIEQEVAHLTRWVY